MIRIQIFGIFLENAGINKQLKLPGILSFTVLDSVEKTGLPLLDTVLFSE